MENKNDLSRKPSDNERIFGIVASSFLFLLFGSLSVLTSGLILDYSWPTLVSMGFGFAAISAGFIAYRMTFGQAERLSSKSVKIVSYLFIVIGILLAGLSFFSGDSPKMSYGIGTGFIAVSIGLKNLFSR